MLPDIAYLASLSRFPKFGAKRLTKLAHAFPTYEEAFRADFTALTRTGIDDEIASAFTAARPEINPEEEWETLAREDIKAMDARDPCFPALLKEIFDPPAVLFYKGDLPNPPDPYPFAVVGSRMISTYGRQAVPELVAPLSRAGLCIVSGMAIGVDSLAHETALKEKGRTIAVLGSGLDRANIYPSQNRYLLDQIIAGGGAVFSEFPPGTPPLRQHFPFRNRIISGMSLGVLVIEAAQDSGSLITAKSALDQNRDVFAVPGNIFSPLSEGPNELLKLGAKAVTSADDILEALSLEHSRDFIDAQTLVPDSPEEASLLDQLSREPIHVDALVKTSTLEVGAVISTLAMMEMKGKVRNLGGMQYVRAR